MKKSTQHLVTSGHRQLLPLLLGGALVSSFVLTASVSAAETAGGGSIDNPAVAPPPAYGIGGAGFVPVKNWHFGDGGTIKNIADMNGEFLYHDQFYTIGNGPNYGALMVAPDAANAVPKQAVEDVKHPVRQFLPDSLRTYLVPLNGATTVKASERNVGCGSFMAKWKLPHGGSLLNQDLLWETRVRYVTPPYFWSAIWAAGNKWNRGAEVDVMESFGYDNGGANTNYDGRYWHSNSVGGTDTLKYASWDRDMKARGFGTFDATQYHTWSWLYRRDNTYSVYLDGVEVQSGAINWTLQAKAAGEPLEMYFLFDGAWGHTGIPTVNKPLAAAELDGKYYEWNYSRVYLRNPAPDAPPVGPVPDPVKPAPVIPVAANAAPTAPVDRTFQVSGKWQNPALVTDVGAAARLKAHPMLKLDLTVPPEADSTWLEVKLAIQSEGLAWTESPKWLLDRAPGATGITKATLTWDTTNLVAKMPNNPNWFKIDLVTQGGQARTLHVDNVRYEDD